MNIMQFICLRALRWMQLKEPNIRVVKYVQDESFESDEFGLENRVAIYTGEYGEPNVRHIYCCTFEEFIIELDNLHSN